MVFGYEERAFFRHVPCLIPSVDLRQGAIDAPATEAVGVALGALEDFLRTDIACPYIRVSQEETLCGREALAFFETLVLGLGGFVLGERQVADLQSAVVGDILT